MAGLKELSESLMPWLGPCDSFGFLDSRGPWVASFEYVIPPHWNGRPPALLYTAAEYARHWELEGPHA